LTQAARACPSLRTWSDRPKSVGVRTTQKNKIYAMKGMQYQMEYNEHKDLVRFADTQNLCCSRRGDSKYVGMQIEKFLKQLNDLKATPDSKKRGSFHIGGKDSGPDDLVIAYMMTVGYYSSIVADDFLAEFQTERILEYRRRLVQEMDESNQTRMYSRDRIRHLGGPMS
jgi:hypothetical protein